MAKTEIIDHIKAKILSLGDIEINSQYTKGRVDILIGVLKVIEDK